MILNIKPAVKSNLDEIVQAVNSSAGNHAPDKAFFADSLCTSEFTSVVVCDKVVQGVCVCTDSQVPDGCEVAAIYIADGFQRMGLGRKLLSYSLREMRSKRYKSAFLWISEKSVDAIAFFKKFGFESDGKKRKNIDENGYYNELRYRIDI